MAPEATVLEELAATREQCRAASELLICPTPEAVDRCSVLLESAGAHMAALREDLHLARGDAQALEAAWQVRRSFQRAARLFENAARFHQNWLSIRGTITGGYTSSGEPAPIRHPGRLCVEA